MNQRYEDNRYTMNNPREREWKPEKRRGRGRLVGALAIGALAAAGAISLFHGSAKSDVKAPQETPLDRLAAQEQVINSSNMLADQLKGDEKAQALAKQIQAELDAKAKDIAGYTITDYNHPKQTLHNSHVTRTVDRDTHGEPTSYNYLEVGDGNSFSVDFGAKDGHANLHDLESVRVLKDSGDDPATSHSESIGRVTYPDGSTAWQYVAIGADSGPSSGPEMNYRSPDQVETLDQLQQVSDELDVRLSHM
jgi:hypothetical protein